MMLPHPLQHQMENLACQVNETDAFVMSGRRMSSLAEADVAVARLIPQLEAALRMARAARRTLDEQYQAGARR